jgi:hypothetical protein
MSARVSIPVPVLAAALLLIAVAMWLQFLPVPAGAPVRVPDGAYATQIETAGFKPLTDGATRVIPGEVKQ